MEVVVEIMESGRQVKRYEKLDADEARIGRGWDNDIILVDPEVDENHAIVEFNATDSGYDEFRVVDCHSLNGSWLQQLKVSGGSAGCGFGDSIRLGQTVIKIHRPGDAVAPAIKQSDYNFPFKLFNNVSVVVALTLFAILFEQAGSIYLDASDFDWVQFSSEVLGIGLAILVTALCLGGISKLIKGGFVFWAHLGLLAAVMLIGSLLTPLLVWVSFNLLSSTVSEILEMLVPAVLLVVWLVPTLYLCTGFTARRRWVFASLSAAVFIAFSYVFPLLQEDDYWWGYETPDLVTTTLPPALLVVPTVSRDDFMTQAGAAFEVVDGIAAEDREELAIRESEPLLPVGGAIN